jgi:hypothetical protein
VSLASISSRAVLDLFEMKWILILIFDVWCVDLVMGMEMEMEMRCWRMDCLD